MKSRRNSRENVRVSHQNESVQNEQTQANSRQSEENRFIKIESQYLQYHYVPSNNSKIGQATPTTVVSITGDLRGWNDIAEIRYANDVSYDKLENPKVILYRNRDNSCYIIFRIEENKHGVFYGINERNIEVGRNSFSVYDLSEDVGSFTDKVARLIYVDESGLYFVSAEENPVESVIDTYQNEGKFKFQGSVVKVSAIDGTLTLNGEPITKENFFDNWVQEERETEKQISQGGGRTVIEKVKETKTVLSTKQPNENEVLRNFYPPNGIYGNMWLRKDGKQLNTFTEIPKRENFQQINLTSKGWMDYFINKRISIAKSKSKSRAEELVRDGTFSSILSTYTDRTSDIPIS